MGNNSHLKNCFLKVTFVRQIWNFFKKEKKFNFMFIDIYLNVQTFKKNVLIKMVNG